MRATVFRYVLSIVTIGGWPLAALADGSVEQRCVEDGQAVEGWYINNSWRGASASYLILQKKQQRTDRFYLCRLDRETRHFVRELGIELEPAASRLEAARCTPADSGVPGNEYFSVIDTNTSRLVRVYRFDALEEDVEMMAEHSVVCSALPAG